MSELSKRSNTGGWAEVIKYVCCNLAQRVGQRVKCLVDFFLEDLVLDGNYRCDKYIINCLGFNADVELLNTIDMDRVKQSKMR